MIKGLVSFYGDSTPKAITIGTSEDVKAPRGLAALEKSGWPIDDDLRLSYKTWLALKRQGDVAADSKFEDWVESVESIEIQPSRKQIEQAVALGTMEREQADRLIAVFDSNAGEAQGQPA